MNPLQKRPFVFLYIALLVLLVIFLFIRNKRLSDELSIVKQENQELVELNRKFNEQERLIEDKDELYAKLAAELHKVKKELEEERDNKKKR